MLATFKTKAEAVEFVLVLGRGTVRYTLDVLPCLTVGAHHVDAFGFPWCVVD